jgi:acyl-CoA hydrolase
VVTEHGLADLRGTGYDQRARALIDIADPSHREALSRSWTEIERDL